jgi:alkylation response protein AidB-like acyl-CoA dehydrogenase
VSLALTAEHRALAEAARGFLESRCARSEVRAALEAEAESLPPFWDEMAAMGWTGLHVAEPEGGQGFGLSELGVVLEETGRAVAPGPLLGVVIAAALLARGASSELKKQVLEQLASGRATAAVAFPATSALVASPAGPGGEISVSGVARPVLSAPLADWLVLRALGAPGDAAACDKWCVLAAGEVTVEALQSLDPTRRVGAVRADAVAIPPLRQLSISTTEVHWIVAALVAAECAGGASWCLETAAEHAKTRRQFDRPIGKFQAVKHRCADMLAAVELTRSAAWDALRAVDEALRQPPAGEAQQANTQLGDAAAQAQLASAAAAAVAVESFSKVAKDCIQVLGGIGFTWEHDAHIYLRRAVSLRQLLGGSAPWRETLARVALAGGRRHLRVELPDDAAGLRAKVRLDCEQVAALPPEKRREALVDAGLFVPHWPPPWGRGAGPIEQLLIDEELRRLGIHRQNLAVGAWAAPTIVAHGTPEQQARWVRPTLLGEITWCQLFSEPDAGSDLASLTTKAVRADQGWLISGQKVWTSLAREADWGICLARTDPSAPKHEGITYFVVDMRSEGIDVRPLRELTGHAMFNEVFLSEVFVPDDCVIGPVNGGWALARTTLANERVAMASGSSFGGGLEALLRLVGDRSLGPLELDALGAVAAEAQALSMLGQRSTLRAIEGAIAASPGEGASQGPEASVRKLLSAEHDQRVQELGLSLLGGEGATTEGAASEWSFGFLANRCLTIAGGTSEIQRNVIAERLLGLPRDV